MKWTRLSCRNFKDGGAALRELAAELDTLFAKIADEAAAP